MSVATWESLAEATLRRQFPAIADAGRGGLTALFERVGPVQSQAARAPFLTASSRLPGVTHATVTAAYEQLDIVRSTSLRGTVHTSLRDDHDALDALARRASMNLWCRTLKLAPADVTRLRGRLEEFTTEGWVTHADLHDRAVGWLAAEGLQDAIAASRDGAGNALYRGHSALLRRPLTGGWHQQGTYGYRTAALVLGERLADPDEAVVRLVRAHLASFGPATRYDIAWWTGDGLRRVDAAVRSLGDDLVSTPGPDGHDYLDLAEPPSSGAGDPGVRLLPEYDALLLGYAPAARVRFADPRAISFSWNQRNGVHAATVLADGRIRGTWRLQTSRQSARLQVSMVPGEHRLREDDLADQAAAVGRVLDTTVNDVEVVTAPDS